MDRRAWIAIAALACGQRNLCATSCAAPPPCARVGVNSILFTGIVTSAGVAAAGDPTPQDTRIQVEEVFAGLEPGAKEVVVEVQGSWMEKGHSYLVDSYRGADGRLYPGICGSSGEVTFEADFLDYLRQRAAGKASRTFGVSVTDQYKPVVEAEVTIVGPGGKLTGRTDADGIVKFEGIKAGKYHVTAERAHYRPDASRQPDEDVELLEGTCGGTNVHLQSEATVSGFVFDAKGVPFPGVALELDRVPEVSSEGLSFSLPAFLAKSTDQGEFRFEAVSPGRYYLGTNLGVRNSPIPRTYYPGRRSQGSAIPIEVKPGEAVENLALSLPDFGVAREIQVCVIDEQSKPVSSAAIGDSLGERGDDFAQLGEKLTTDETGCVKASGYTRVAYAVHANLRPTNGDAWPIRFSEDFVVSPGEGPVHVVLTLNKTFSLPLPKQ